MHCAGEASDRPHDRSAQAPSTLICDHSPGLAPTRKTRESRISRCDRAAQGAHRLGLRRPRYLVGTDQAGEEATSPGGRWSGDAPPHKQKRIRAWSDRLTSELLDDLQEWNDAWDSTDANTRALQERGPDLASRVQDEVGTDGWEVLYKMDGQLQRVHPPGSWPVESWEQQLLGYAPRRRQPE